MKRHTSHVVAMMINITYHYHSKMDDASLYPSQMPSLNGVALRLEIELLDEIMQSYIAGQNHMALNTKLALSMFRL